MEWQDEGFILHTQSLGERKQVLSLFTLTHGRSTGVFYITSKNKAWVQCGGKVKARWGARLETHMGSWILEPLSSNIAFLFDSPGPLMALSSATALCQLALPERHAYPELYESFEALINDLMTPHWAISYVHFERALLEELGYGLDLSVCAVTGVSTELTAVSPRTGRAVSKDVAKPYEGRLLSLPSFLLDKNKETLPHDEEILDALHLTGYFLERYLLSRELPAARRRLLQRFTKTRKSA